MFALKFNRNAMTTGRKIANIIERQVSNEVGNSSVQRIRLYKRIGAGVLFVGTLAGAVYAKRTKAAKMKMVLENCERLPDDPDYTSTVGTEFFRCSGCVFPATIVKSGTLQKLETTEIRPDDIIVASFPKSGTTWVQEIVYLIHTGLDFESAQKQVLESRFPYLEYPYPGLTSLSKQKGARLIKTHLPSHLMPKSAYNNGAKIIYIARNPKDVAVSYYHFLRMASFISYRGLWSDFLQKFVKGDVPYGPFFSHVLGYWEKSKSQDANILWLTYEEMHKDPESSIRKIATFLDHPLTDDQIRLVAEYTRFEKMASNPAVNYSHWDDLGLRNKQETPFMRKGRVGDWTSYFDGKQLSFFDSWVAENLKNSDLKFDYSAEQPTESN